MDLPRDLEEWVLQSLRNKAFEDLTDVTLEVKDEETGEELTTLKLHRYILNRAEFFRAKLLKDKERISVDINTGGGMITKSIVRNFFHLFYLNVHYLGITAELVADSLAYYHLSSFFMFGTGKKFFHRVITDNLTAATIQPVLEYALHTELVLPDSHQSLRQTCMQWIKAYIMHQTLETRRDLIRVLPLNTLKELIVSTELVLSRLEDRCILIDMYNAANSATMDKLHMLELEALKKSIRSDPSCLGLLKTAGGFDMFLYFPELSPSHDSPDSEQLELKQFVSDGYYFSVHLERQQGVYSLVIMCDNVPRGGVGKKKSGVTVKVDCRLTGKDRTLVFEKREMIVPGSQDIHVREIANREVIKQGFWRQDQQKRALLLSLRITAQDGLQTSVLGKRNAADLLYEDPSATCS